MGWFWDTKANEATGDATRNLDPSLKDFLDKQTSEQSRHGPVSPTPPPQRYVTPSASDSLDRAQPDAAQSTDASNPTVPKESLFQDGRYAHLWKNYKPESATYVGSGSEQDKIIQVLETIKDRKAAIGRAALENCVEEQMAERDCYRTGTWMDRMMMCRTQQRAFNRCFSMQARFLRALGYLSSEHATPADEEKIQMHADKLYHEMLEREQAMEEARKAGNEESPDALLQYQQAVIPSESTTKALGEDSAWARARRKAQTDGSPVHLSDFPPAKQAEVKERLSKLTPTERQVELQLMAAEDRALREYIDQIDEEHARQKRERDARRAAGQETVGDTLKRLAGFGER